MAEAMGNESKGRDIFYISPDRGGLTRDKNKNRAHRTTQDFIYYGETIMEDMRSAEM